MGFAWEPQNPFFIQEARAAEEQVLRLMGNSQTWVGIRSPVQTGSPPTALAPHGPGGSRYQQRWEHAEAPLHTSNHRIIKVGKDL